MTNGDRGSQLIKDVLHRLGRLWMVQRSDRAGHWVTEHQHETSSW
jgi:hypothetical protein